MQLMLRMAALASCLFMVSACADDSDGGSDASLPQCVDISGSWTIEEHCQADLVGDEVVVAQDGCDFSDETFGFSGTVEADGTVTATTGGTDPTTCTGTATATTLTEHCTGFMAPCDVRLRR